MGKPEKSYKCGSCEAAIFVNEIDRNGQAVKIKKVVFQKRYKDQDDQWRSTGTLDMNDIPKAILALSKAYTYLMSSTDIKDKN
jgi:hypothetical protein